MTAGRPRVAALWLVVAVSSATAFAERGGRAGSIVDAAVPVTAAGSTTTTAAAPVITTVEPMVSATDLAAVAEVAAASDAVARMPARAEPAIWRGNVTAIGDSVMLAAKRGLEAVEGWTVRVDAEVNRQFAAGVPLLVEAGRRPPHRVVLHLGTNGAVTDDQFDAAMRAVAGVERVIVLTVQLPARAGYAHEDATNEVLRRGARRWHAVLVDWNAATEGHHELFAADGVHLRPAGASRYTELVAAAL